MGLPNDWNELIKFGCDGTILNRWLWSENVSAADSPLDWSVLVPCTSTGTVSKGHSERYMFSSIDEMLLRVIFIRKVTQKCHEIQVVNEEIQACFTHTEFPNKGGHNHNHFMLVERILLPHKVAALLFSYRRKSRLVLPWNVSRSFLSCTKVGSR